MDILEAESTESMWMSSKPDDDELARAISDKWRETVRFLYGQWHVYERGCWRIRAPQQMQMGLRDVLRQFRKSHEQIEITISQTRVAGLSKMLQSDLFISDEEFNAMLPEQEKYINLQNGLFNLETYQLEPHKPELRFTTQLDFAYDASADCPLFIRYLKTSLVDAEDKTDLELIYLVQEALAYSLTARTDMKASFWLVGKPNSGKSTLLALIRGLMGSLHATIDLNQLSENRFLLSGIAGKRVVTFSEANESVVLPDALYKAMVGGSDEIYADVKNRPGISFKPIAKFWWAMNSAPRMTDRSGATLNRLKVIPFIRSVPPEKAIPNLERLLMFERPGIFNWLMEGYQRLLEQRAFTVSEQSEQWRENYKLENDTEQTFINERCERVAGERVQAEALYKAYKHWCDDNGFRPRNMNQAAKEWERLGLTRSRINGSSYWYGLRFMPSPLGNLD